MSTLFANFWEKYGSAILLIAAIGLIFIVAFRAGQLNKEVEGAAKINISLANGNGDSVVGEKAKVIEDALKRKGLEGESDLISEGNDRKTSDQRCAFVASKNSKKYHLPNCSNAIRIKDSNKLCFSSTEDVEDKGYEKAKCCHK